MYKKLSDKPASQVQLEQIKHWNDIDLLGLCVKERKDAPSFVFYEGPPTANGKPGIHHVMARTLKDSVNRYKTMQGFCVKRKGGWDTHGLPVEIEVEKELGMTGKQDIEKYGIKEFNEKCRESVFKYTSMWKDMSERMAYMADMDNPYITYDNNYIETEWWILKQFFNEGLIYEGYKILPYCPRCGTGLASHEVAQGYKEVKVNTLICKFKLEGKDNEYFLAWTTTPWTLCANSGLTVGPDILYAKVKMTSGENEGNIFYLANNLLSQVLGSDSYEVLDTFKGKELEGLRYEQLMPFIKIPEGKQAFVVTCMDYVSIEDGTGIVHTAPAFGEDDYNCGRKYNLAVLQPVDEKGCYIGTPWKGHFVMEEGLDVEIIKYLAKDNKIFKKEKIVHNYPHCWRCQTPLLYYARKSWYIEMTKLRDDLVANNNQVNWYPDYVGDKRFGNWLSEVKDWAISRSRYWGTPIPIWQCECGALECIGSREELISKSNENIDMSIELHRPYVDEITINCPKCGKPMHRILDVMDCWFDSGSMPFAQWHYPFENSEHFDDELFPADFICEGIDQTRGWFYSLLAISTFIKKSAPYRNVLVNDLILDKDGKKMSKSRGNTVSPFELMDKYGADALRWYLLYSSPAWTPTKFDEEGVKEVISKVFTTLRNAYNFFTLYSNIDNVEVDKLDCNIDSRPELDKWIISKYNRMILDVTSAIDSYEHMRAVRTIGNFIVDDFSNWYIRRARRRFFASGMDNDKSAAYATTYEILLGLSKIMAPFAPFISDEIYVNLTGNQTVHTEYFPKPDESLINSAIEERMDLVKTLVNLGHGTREEHKLKVRQALNEVIIDGKYESLISDLTPLIKEELNVKQVVFEPNLEKYMNYQIKPNFRVAGPEFGSEINAFAKVLSDMDPAKLISDIAKGSVNVNVSGKDYQIDETYIDVRIISKEGFAAGMENNIFTILDTKLTDELIEEGYVREIISKIQQLRKQMDLEMMDKIVISFDADDEITTVIEKNKDFIMNETIGTEINYAKGLEEYDINGHITYIGIAKH